jgi:hypothetical protein
VLANEGRGEEDEGSEEGLVGHDRGKVANPRGIGPKCGWAGARICRQMIDLTLPRRRRLGRVKEFWRFPEPLTGARGVVLVIPKH